MFVFVSLCITVCPFYFCNLEEEEKAGCFAIIVLQIYCYYKCSVALPHCAVGWLVLPGYTQLLSDFITCVCIT